MDDSDDKLKKGFKVVVPFNPILPSPPRFVSWCERKCACVLYTMKRDAFPRLGCGPLCVFDNLENAMAPLMDGDDAVVCECLYEPSKLMKVWRGDGNEGMALAQLPLGTKLASRVRLIRKVM